MRTKDDELLIRGLSILKELEFSHVPCESEIDHTFSERYIKNQEKLLNKIGRTYWKYVNTVAKKVAIIIVTLIITFSSLMTVDAFREKVINFMYNIYKTFTKIESRSTEQNKVITNHYSILTIPPHFVQTTVFLTDYIFTLRWTNDVQQDISLSQVFLSDSHKFNSEHGELSESIINDTPCLICKTNTAYFCYWEFDGYRFELVYPIDLGEEFMGEVVGHLVEVDPEELTTE